MEHFILNFRRTASLCLWIASLPLLAARADDATAQYNVASGFYNMSRYEFAAEEYEKYLKDFPKHEQVPEALYFLGESYYHLNKIEAARTRYREVLIKHRDARNFYNALYRIGETSLLLNEPKAAETALAEFVAKRPDDPLLEFALPYLGRAQSRNGKYAEAKQSLSKAIDRYPKGRLIDQTQFDLAQTLDQLGERDQATRLYQAIAATSSAKLADHAQLAIGTRHFDDKNFEAALEAFQELERRFPDSQWLHAARLNRALCLYQLQRYDQARTLLERLSRSEAKDLPEAFHWLGMTQKAQGDFEGAAATLLDAIARFPDSAIAPDMLFHAGHAQFQLGRYENAITQFHQLASKHTKHELADDALYFAIESARSAGENDQALDLAAQFFREHPTSSLTGQVMLSVGQSLIAAGRHEEAAKYFEEFLGRKPAAELAIPARYYHAVALRAADRPDDAIRALEPMPTAGELTDAKLVQFTIDAQFLLGSIYFDQKQYGQAVGPFEQYLKAQPSGDVAGHAASYLAVSLAALQRFNDLEGPLRTVRKADRAVATPALFRVAELCLESKEYAIAADLYAEVVESDRTGPLAVRALSGLGWSRYHAGRFASAARTFDQLLEAAPDDPLAGEAAYMLGRSLEADNKLLDAAAAYHAAFNKYPNRPQAPDAALQFARVLKKQKKDPEAISAYDELARRFPEYKQLDAALYEWAWTLQQAGLEPDAQKIFDRLAKQFPNSSLMSEAVINVCETLYQSKQFSAVVSRLKPLLAMELPPVVREAALYRLGRTYVELAQWPEAKAAFHELVDSFASSRLRRESEFWIAESDRQQGNAKAAIERLVRLIQEPVEPEPWLGTAYLRLAQAYGEQKQWKELLGTAEQLRKQFPKYELLNVADYHSGRALQNLARFDEAREVYRRGIAGRSDENAAQCQFMIGETYFHQKRYQEALREFLKVEILYAFPHWQAAALLEAGKCHESLQEWSRAAETYHRILEKYPKTAHGEEAAARRTAALEKVTANSKK